MPIKIVSPSEPVDIRNVKVLLMGQPGIGKTTLANTANKPLLLDFDGGSYRSLNRQPTVNIDKWSDVESISRDDVAGFKTIVIDTIGRCLDVISDDLMSKDPKMSAGGQLSLRGYGALKMRFRAWLNRLTLWDLDVVMLAHTKEESRDDDTVFRVDAQGSSKEEVYKQADMMGRLFSSGGKRVLDWNPTDAGFGKNPGELETSVVPHVSSDSAFLKSQIETTLDRLCSNANSIQRQKERIDELHSEWAQKLTTATAFNRKMQELIDANAPFTEKKLLLKVADNADVMFDRTAKAFVSVDRIAEEEEAVEEGAF